MDEEILFASIEWGYMSNGEIIESQMMVYDNKEDAIEHCKKYAHSELGSYVEKYLSINPDKKEVVWGSDKEITVQ